jgi:hypothetical protein
LSPKDERPEDRTKEGRVGRPTTKFMSLSNISSDLDEDIVLSMEEFQLSAVSSDSILLLLPREHMVREDLSWKVQVFFSEEIVL